MSDVRTDVIQHGERLEYFTILWNTLEGLLSIAAGLSAGSIALVGFGLDSFIEVVSGSAGWQFPNRVSILFSARRPGTNSSSSQMPHVLDLNMLPWL
jgi:hypothetical protein